MDKVDKLIAKLQVHNYRIRINNYNIGTLHNIYAERFIPNQKEPYFYLSHVGSWVLDLPKEMDGLIDILQGLLNGANNEKKIK